MYTAGQDGHSYLSTCSMRDSKILRWLVMSILVLLLVVFVATTMTGCSGGPFRLPFFNRTAGESIAAVSSNPMAPLIWISPLCVLAGLVMLIALQMRKEGAMFILAGFGIAITIWMIEQYLILILIGIGILVISFTSGSLSQRLGSLWGWWKLRKEAANGKPEEARAAEALLREGFPAIHKWTKKKEKRN